MNISILNCFSAGVIPVDGNDDGVMMIKMMMLMTTTIMMMMTKLFIDSIDKLMSGECV